MESLIVLITIWGIFLNFPEVKSMENVKKTNTRLMNAPVHSWLYRTIIRGLSSENSFLKGLSESTWPSDHEMVGPFPK